MVIIFFLTIIVLILRIVLVKIFYPNQGSIERNENPEDAAEREVYEEAGVKGRLGRLLGIFEVFEVYF